MGHLGCRLNHSSSADLCRGTLIPHMFSSYRYNAIYCGLLQAQKDDRSALPSAENVTRVRIFELSPAGTGWHGTGRPATQWYNFEQPLVYLGVLLRLLLPSFSRL